MFDEVELLKKEKKKKLILYTGAFIVSASLMIGGSLSIYDSSVDHTKEICPITQILNIGAGENLGITHQLEEMKAESGNDLVYFKEDYTKTYDEEVSSSVRYVAPRGYDIVYIDGVPKAVKRKTADSEVDVENRDVTYVAPPGYEIIYIDGDPYAKKTEVHEEYISPIMVRQEDGSYKYVAPAGYTLVNKDGEILCYRKTTTTEKRPLDENIIDTQDVIVTVPEGSMLETVEGEDVAVKRVRRTVNIGDAFVTYNQDGEKIGCLPLR